MNEHSSIRVLVVDDHRVVRKGISSLLSTPRYQIEIVGEAANGLEAISQNRALHPDVILMDLEMPHMGGLEAIAAIMAEFPQARILVLTSFNEVYRAKEAIQVGAKGFLFKDASTEDLLYAIRSVYQGQVLLPPDIAAQLIGGAPGEEAVVIEDEPLTAREQTVLRLLAQGLSNKAIAQQLNVSPNTVRAHMRNILGKLGVDNRTQAALYAAEHGYLDP